MMKITFNVPKPVVITAGQHTAKKTGFLFERRIAEGSEVTVSQSFLDEHKEKTGRDFTSSWLEPAKETKAPISEPAKAEETKAKPKQ
jgi:hypothetical protein